MKNKLLMLVCTTLFVSALNAQVSNQIQGVEIHNFEATQLDNGANMFIVPLTTEVKVLATEPKNFKMKETITLPEINPNETDKHYADRIQSLIQSRIAELKTQALFEFADATNAALIISPIYSIKTESSNGYTVNVVVKVKGYPAIYTKFRNLTPADSITMRLSRNIPQNKEILDPTLHTTVTSEEEKVHEEVVKITDENEQVKTEQKKNSKKK